MMPGPTGFAELFLKFDYAETKDLAKSFLTLSSGVLVFSLAFSEKVVNYQAAPLQSRLAMALAWISGILSIIFCGVGLVYISIAGGAAVYGGDFERTAARAYQFITMAGFAFVGELLALVVSAIFSLLWSAPKR